MRSLFLCALIGVVATSHASFDLLLVPDQGSAFGPVYNRIHRYDGDTGAYLGFFNAGTSSIGSMAADSANGTAYIYAASRIYGYDYSTGVQNYASGTLVNVQSIKVFNGALYALTNSSLLRINTATNTTTLLLSASGVAFRDIAFLPNGSYAIIDETGSRLMGYSSTNVLSATATLPSYSALGNIAWDGASANGLVAQYRQTTTSSIIVQARVSFPGSFGSFSSSTYLSSFAQNSIDLESAHDGTWLLARNNSGTLSAYLRNRFDSPVNGFAMPQVNTPGGHMAVVLAPEPGTMAALAFGLGAVVRMRRKKK